MRTLFFCLHTNFQERETFVFLKILGFFFFFLKMHFWVPTKIKQKAQRFLKLTCALASPRASI